MIVEFVKNYKPKRKQIAIVTIVLYHKNNKKYNRLFLRVRT